MRVAAPNAVGPTSTSRAEGGQLLRDPLKTEHPRASIDVPGLRPANNVVMKSQIPLRPRALRHACPILAQKRSELRKSRYSLDRVRGRKFTMPVRKQRVCTRARLTYHGNLALMCGQRTGENVMERAPLGAGLTAFRVGQVLRCIFTANSSRSSVNGRSNAFLTFCWWSCKAQLRNVAA